MRPGQVRLQQVGRPGQDGAVPCCRYDGYAEVVWEREHDAHYPRDKYRDLRDYFGGRVSLTNSFGKVSGFGQHCSGEGGGGPAGDHPGAARGQGGVPLLRQEQEQQRLSTVRASVAFYSSLAPDRFDP